MNDSDTRTYAPKHARRIERIQEPVPEVHEISEDIPVFEPLKEENRQTETVSDNLEQSVLNDSPPQEETVPVRKRRWWIDLTLILLAAVLLAVIVGRMDTKDPHSLDTDEPEETVLEPMDPKLRDMWLSNKAINPDYIGQIVFDSGMIDLPVVQAGSVYDRNGDMYTFYTEEGILVEDPEGHTGNDVYIWTGWKSHEYDPYGEDGAPFMHWLNDLDDQNIIIFGHHFARDFDPSGSRQFTPLDLLLEEKNYEENCTLKLILDNEIREYEVTNVFVISIYDDYDTQIIRTDMNRDLSGNYDQEFFSSYIKYMDGKSVYDTGIELSNDDRILTLITCVEHQSDLRQIVVCRQTEDTIYSG